MEFRTNMIGKKVIMNDPQIHTIMPNKYPEYKTIGIILEENPEEEDYLVAWEKGTTSEDGCWYCHAERLEEYVPKHKTIEEIMCEFHKFNSNLTFDLSRLYKKGKFKSNIKLSNEQLEQIICLSYDLGRNSNE